MEPKTTFLIPTINRNTLQRAINSINQAPFIVEFDKDRIGPGKIRNNLIQKATTEWVSFLDDDDTVTSDYVERLEEETLAHPEADLIHFRQYFLTGQIFPNWPKVEWGNVGICFSVKREVALEYPFKTEDFEDYEFVRRLSEAGKKIVYSPYLVYKVRH